MLFQLEHGWRDIAGCDDILLLANGRLDDSGVESVRNQGNDKVASADFSIKDRLVRDIERNRAGVLEAFG